MRPVLSLTAQGVAIVLLIAGAVSYGYWRLSEDSFPSGPMIGLIQGNLPQSIRNQATNNVEQAIEDVKNHYTDLTDRAMAQKVKPSLLVWPETSYPYDWLETAPDVPAHLVPPEWDRDVRICRILARDRAERWRADLLMGLNCSMLEPTGKEIRYNSAVFTK